MGELDDLAGKCSFNALEATAQCTMPDQASVLLQFQIWRAWHDLVIYIALPVLAVD